MAETSGLVVFTLAGQSFALPLPAVERVVRAVEVTPAPQAPDFVLGLVNLQGRVIPVLDLRRRFGLPEREIELSDQFIITDTAARTVALVADTVSGVIGYTQGEESAAGLDSLTGVLKRDGEMILIYNLAKLLTLDEQKLLDALQEG